MAIHRGMNQCLDTGLSGMATDDIHNNTYLLVLDQDEDPEISHDSKDGLVETSLPGMEDGPYLLESDSLLSDAQISHEQDDVYHSAAISLHSYSQSLPSLVGNLAGVGLHNYSQPVRAPNMEKLDVLHNYSQPWPQSTDSFTSVHNYCISNEEKTNKDTENTKIIQVTKSDSNEPVCVKIQYSNIYSCHWLDCEVLCDSIHELGTHVMTHINVPRQPDEGFICYWRACPREGRGFEIRHKLVQHVRIHTMERPYKCSLCHAEFACAEGLTKHQRTHTGEKPYPCTYPNCKKAFKTSGDRVHHMRTHQKRPYECKYPDCGKKYTDPSSLRKHMRCSNHNTTVKKVCTTTVQKKIQAASILSSSGSETALNISQVDLADIAVTNIYSDSSSNPLLSSTNLQSGHKSLRQEEPLDLSAPADILLLHTDDMVD